MTDRRAAIAAYTAALMGPDENSPALVAAVLTADVVVQTNFGRAEGREAAVALLREPRTVALLAGGARWSRPAADGDRMTVTATLPPTAPFRGLDLAFEFTAVDGALDNQTPMLIAYLDDEQHIHLSFRGTIQAYSDDQLALWAREPAGGLPRNIGDRPQVTLFYNDPASRTSYTFYGRARVEADPAVRAAIFENTHPREQQMDFSRRGVAIVVDLDRIEGRAAGGRVLMRRAEPHEKEPAG